jgi:hypothetical protein
MASSGKNREREALVSGFGLAVGVQKSSHPERGNAVIEKICSFSPSREVTWKDSVFKEVLFIEHICSCSHTYFVATMLHISLHNI